MLLPGSDGPIAVAAVSKWGAKGHRRQGRERGADLGPARVTTRHRPRRRRDPADQLVPAGRHRARRPGPTQGRTPDLGPRSGVGRVLATDQGGPGEVVTASWSGRAAPRPRDRSSSACRRPPRLEPEDGGEPEAVIGPKGRPSQPIVCTVRHVTVIRVPLLTSTAVRSGKCRDACTSRRASCQRSNPQHKSSTASPGSG